MYVYFERLYRGLPKFSFDLRRVAYWGGTVSFFNLQLAAYLGCNPIVLIGFDHSYRGTSRPGREPRHSVDAGGRESHPPRLFRPRLSVARSKCCANGSRVSLRAARTGVGRHYGHERDGRRALGSLRSRSLRQPPLSVTELLTVGLVGCGAVAHANYARTLRGRSAYAVRYVFDIVPHQAESAARLFGAEVAAMDDLIQHANAIVVTTPPHTHADLIRKSLRPGKIVLCEKPFTTSYRDAVDLANEATSTGALLYVGHFRRNFPQVQLARSLVELGVVGEITDMFVSEGGRFTWKAVSDYNHQG